MISHVREKQHEREIMPAKPPRRLCGWRTYSPVQRGS